VFSHVVHPLGAAEKALGSFVQVNAGTISPAEYFSPENIGAIMAVARATT
jgi:hypothetical protein